jgi:hypothetical protein
MDLRAFIWVLLLGALLELLRLTPIPTGEYAGTAEDVSSSYLMHDVHGKLTDQAPGLYP